MRIDYSTYLPATAAITAVAPACALPARVRPQVIVFPAYRKRQE